MNEIAEHYQTGFQGDVPAHVPPQLIRHFDFDQGPGMNRCPHAVLAKVAQAPERMLFNLVGQDLHGRSGYWLPTRAADVRELLQRTDLFSAKGIARFSALMGESWDLIPAEIDPPAHTRYRQFLNPMFGPAAVKAIEPRIRAHAQALIAKMAGSGDSTEIAGAKSTGVEFIQAFAKPFPILIVMIILGLPLERYDDVVAWGHDLHDGTSIEQRARGAVAIGAFIREEIAKAKLAPPREDVVSRIALGAIDGEPFTDDELIGMIYLVFTGGIHTVTASLGFHFDHLARHPELQALLRAEPARIPAAIDEMLRLFSIVSSARVVTSDTRFAGVDMKAGDWVSLPFAIVNFDAGEFPDPTMVDITRKPNRQMSFSFGNHFCLGAHLARTELRIAYEELLGALPPFRAPEEPHMIGGSLLGVERLLLDWS